MRLVRTLVPLTAVLALAGASASAGAADPWRPLHRPLQLARLEPGAACPAYRSHTVDHGRISAIGLGPVYPGGFSFSRYDRRPAWLGSKTIWSWPSELKTQRLRVLVRGRRLDRPGSLRFQLGPQWESAPATAELRVDTTRTVGSFSTSDWGTTVTMLLVHAHGCYGLQLDTAEGTAVIVLRA